ncbi:MAG: hypothetical protein U9R49_02740 [Bacteroidota bacterium]|nr:hypothetical protein [Bacteroidota bacterium]
MKKLLLLTVLSALVCSSLTAQNLHRVNNNTDFDADFTILQAAVTAASNNDTIYVEGSATEYEGATINKPLTIVGPGFFLNENPKTQANNVEATFNSDIAFTSGSEGSTIMGCRFLNGTDLNISVSDISVIRNYLYNLAFIGTSNNILVLQNYVRLSIVATGGVITNAIISNNIIQGQIDSEATSGPLIVANNVCFTTNWAFPIDVHNAVIQNNILIGEYATIYENTGNTISYNIMAEDGTDANGNQYNIDMDLVFADFDGTLQLSTDGKWELKAGSPALAAGSGGVDCGAFGGPTPYVLSGIPGLPHIYEADVPATATTDSGLPVTIKVMSGD